MTQPRSEPDPLPPGALSLEVALAGVCLCVSAGVTTAAVVAGGSAEAPDQLILLGWPLMAIGGGVVLDRRPGSRVGRTMAVLSTVPLVVVAYVFLRSGGVPSQQDWSRATAGLAALQAALPWVALPWAMRTPAPARRTLPLLGCVLGGGLAVLLGVAPVGWALVVGGVAGLGLLTARSSTHEDRDPRRRLGLLYVALAVAGLAVAVSAGVAEAATTRVVAGLVLATLATAVCWIELSHDLRPGDEVMLDLAVGGCCVLAAAGAAALVALGTEVIRRPAPGSAVTLSAGVTLAMVVPAGLWVRRSFLVRRYGTGIIAPADVEAITADLHSRTDPRALLDKAANLVAAASGSRGARIVLGAETPETSTGWFAHALSVGGDQVGTLLVDAGTPEGSEPRQQRVVAQLRPTVALMSRAVGLAVEAEHARQDVARERDAERRRVLGDLHDGLGPLLAGMSMRVRAALRGAPPPQYADLLDDLVGDLSLARADLRRLVSGITPSALDDADLATALAQLAASFGAADGSPRVSLEVDVPVPLPSTLDIAVYRCVAEGLTNALRHAHASVISVSVRRGAGRVVTTIEDDGVGGVVVPGVGLTSLLGRARSLDGCLDLSTRSGPGLSLRMELPCSPGLPSAPCEAVPWSA